MNALGGVCWAAIFGFGAYWFGEQIMSVAAPVGIALLAGAVLLAIAGTVLMRRYEKQWIVAARAALKEPEPIGS